MRSISRAILVLSLLYGGGRVSGQNVGEFHLRPFDAGYRLSHNKITVGRVMLKLDCSVGKYRYQAHTVPSGLISILHSSDIKESSKGLIEGQRIVPLEYRYTRHTAEKTRATALDFDWERMQVTNRSGQSQWVMAIPAGTQDKFALQLTVMADLAKGRQTGTYPVADGGRLKHFEFTTTGSEIIHNKMLGQIKTIRVSRAKQGKTADAVFWFAPTMNYLAVRIDRKRNNTQIRMELDSLMGTGQSSQPSPLPGRSANDRCRSNL